MGLETTLLYVTAAISVGTAIYSFMNMPEDPTDKGLEVQKRGTDSPRRVIYGKSLVGSTNVYNNIVDSRGIWLTRIFALGIGEVTNIHNIYIDDEPVFVNDITTTDSVLDSTYSGNFSPEYQEQNTKLQMFLGTENQAASILAINGASGGSNVGTPNYDGESGVEYEQAVDDAQQADPTINDNSDWTSAHRGARVAYAVISSARSQHEDAPITSPNYSMTALVSGMAVYDPRYHTLGEKEYFHSDVAVPVINRQCGRNGAICLLDFLTDTYYGMSIPLEYINIPSFESSANWIDLNELHIDGVVNTGDNYGACLTQIMSTFQGILVMENGLVTCKYEDTVLLPFATTFDESNTIEIKDVIGATASSYYNIVEVDYKNSAMDERKDVYQIPSDILAIPSGATKSRIEADGFTKTFKLEMPMTIDNVGGVVSKAVKYFGNIAYIKALYQKGITIVVDLSEHDVKMYDVIKISNETIGYTDKLFRVNTITNSTKDTSFNHGTLVCVEYSDNIYNGNLDGISGANGIRSTKVLLPVIDLVFTLDDFATVGYGTLTWDDPNNIAGIEYYVEYKLSSSPDWVVLTTTNNTSAKVPNLRFVNYDFRVSCRRFGWYVSPWTELLSQAMSVIAGMPFVTGLNSYVQDKNFEFTWDDMLDAVVTNPVDPTNPDASNTSGKVIDYFKSYQVEIYHGVVLKQTYITTDPKFTYLFSDNTVHGLSRDVDIKVGIVDIGDSPINKVTLSVTNLQMGIPNNVATDQMMAASAISWQPRSESDFYGTEIHISNTPSFTPSGATLHDTLQTESKYIYTFPLGDTADKYCKIGHYDVFDNNAMAYSTELTLLYEFAEIVVDLTEINADILALEAETEQLLESVIWNTTLHQEKTTDIGYSEVNISENEVAIITEEGARVSQGTQLNTRIATAENVTTGQITRVDLIDDDLLGKTTAISNLEGTVNNATTGVTATYTIASSAQTDASGNGIAINTLNNSVYNVTTGLSATNSIAQSASTTASGNATAITTIGSSVTDIENLTTTGSALELAVNATTASFYLSAEVEVGGFTKVVGIKGGVNGTNSLLDFQADVVRFLDNAGTPKIYFNTGFDNGDGTFGRYVFDGTLYAENIEGDVTENAYFNGLHTYTNTMGNMTHIIADVDIAASSKSRLAMFSQIPTSGDVAGLVVSLYVNGSHFVNLHSSGALAVGEILQSASYRIQPNVATNLQIKTSSTTPRIGTIGGRMTLAVFNHSPSIAVNVGGYL